MFFSAHSRQALVLTGLLASTHSYAQFYAHIDPSTISNNEPCELTLTEDRSVSGDPDLSPLQQDFIIQGQNRSSTMEIQNGSLSQLTQIQISLLPRHPGVLLIPALHWANDVSQPLHLTVTNAAASVNPTTPGNSAAMPDTGTNVTNSPLYITETLSSADAYVQSPVLLTVEIHTQVPIYQASMDLPATADILVRPWGKDQQSQELHQGQTWQVIRRQYLLIAQKQGNLTLPGSIVDAQVQDNGLSSLFGPGAFGSAFATMRPIRRQGDPIHIEVHSWPIDAGGNSLVPARTLTAHLNWPQPKDSVQVGDPITVHLHEEATGLTGEALPDLSVLLNLDPHIQHYSDPPKLSTQAEGNQIVGVRDQDIALIASSAGIYKIPDLQFLWWNTHSHTPQKLTVDGTTITISANPNAPIASAQPTATTTQHSVLNHQSCSSATKPSSAADHTAYFWKNISLILSLLWVLTLGGFGLSIWSKRRTKPSKPTISNNIPKKSRTNARQQFHQACTHNQPEVARQALLDWANSHWVDSATYPFGIEELMERFREQPDLCALLEQLNQACYGQNSQWQGQALANALDQLPTIEKKRSKAPQLPELYP